LERLVSRSCDGGKPTAPELALLSFLVCRALNEAFTLLYRESERLSRLWGSDIVFESMDILKCWLHEGLQVVGQAALYSALSRQLGVSDMDTEVPAIVEQGIAAFSRDLDALLKEHPKEWVAYHGPEQVAMGRTDYEVLQDCLAKGFNEGELVIRRIQPDLPSIRVTW